MKIIKIKISFEMKTKCFRFPKNPIKRAQWIADVRRQDWQPSQYSHLCSEHFTEQSFEVSKLFIICSVKAGVGNLRERRAKLPRKTGNEGIKEPYGTRGNLRQNHTQQAKEPPFADPWVKETCCAFNISSIS